MKKPMCALKDALQICERVLRANPRRERSPPEHTDSAEDRSCADSLTSIADCPSGVAPTEAFQARRLLRAEGRGVYSVIREDQPPERKITPLHFKGI